LRHSSWTSAIPRVAVPSLAAALAVLATGGTARAEASAADKAAARDLAIAGIQLADRGDCAGAVVKLKTAADLYPAPTVVERLGECQIALGKIVAGTESLQSVVHAELGPSPNPVFVEAQRRAQKALDAARSRIPKVVIHLAGPAPADARVTLDGERVPPALLDGERPTDPGLHQIAASAPGFKDAISSITLAEGARSEVTLTLEPIPSAAPVLAPTSPVLPPGTATPGVPPAPAPEQPAPAPTSSSGGSIALPVTALVLGAAGLGVGGTFGLLAMGKKSTLDSACDPGKSCPGASQQDIDAMNTNATVSTVGFIAGGVLVATGFILLLTRSSGSEGAPHAAVTPLVGPGSLGLGGAF
jgi:hypothetical protein